ncbi:heavy-metal-associated domain-containing protein [Salidesulfovibrio brasiliensis]|uniref:heavy-metal-associated domain-containing protein n=1 Tax=Salidesulfovibrio brasiliensis TaxID=221711 RepID=UPI0006D1C30F|nr:cation transporter [Salidesulfovibrio brasiliensis]
MAQVKVGGMSCGHCVASVTKALEALDGVKNVNVTLETGIAEYDEEKPVDPGAVKDAVTKIGFEVKE